MALGGETRSPSWTRRGALSLAARWTAVGAVAVSPSALRAAALPTPQNPVIELRFQANNQGTAWNATMLGLDQQFVDANFNTRYRGLRAKVDPAGWGNLSGQIAASIAGQGYDDVWASCCSDFAAIMESGWALPVNSYLQQDNLTTSLWSAGHMAALNMDGQQMALPSYDGPVVVAYRQDILDQLGLRYPDPNWTYTDALKLWESATGHAADGKWRYGTRGNWFGPNHWQAWIKGWGGEVTNATRDRFLANSPKVVSALDFPLYIYRNKIENPNGADTGSLERGTAVFSFRGG